MPIILTMWDQFLVNECAVISKLIDTKPIIVAFRLKAVQYNGNISLLLLKFLY